MRLIDADELKKELTRHEPIIIFNRNYDGLLADIIDNAPTVDFIISPKGKWKHIIEEDNDVECPFCGFQEDGIYYNFCPNCGADLRREES